MIFATHVLDELKDKLDSYKKEKEALGKDLKVAIDDVKSSLTKETLNKYIYPKDLHTDFLLYHPTLKYFINCLIFIIQI